MTAKVVRIIMILLTVFIASIVLPDFYKTSFRRNVKYVSLNYSEVTKQFVIWGLKDGVLLDTLGNEYSRQEYERMVPFSSMPQLLKRNEFPDTVAGVPVTPQLVAENNYRHIVNLTERGRYYAMSPLVHGGTDRIGYIYTNDMMRVNRNGIEFYNCEDGRVDKEKSALFDQELRKLGYCPPAKKLYGRSATGYKRDDGLFFVDSKDQLFQVRYHAYKPDCRKIELPDQIKLRRVECEPDHPEVVAYLFGDNNGVYILTVDNQIIKLDLDEFNYDQFKVFDVMGNLFYHMISIQKDGYEKLYIFDRDYKLLDKYGVHSDVYEESAAGVVEGFLFPFVTSTYSYINGYYISSEGQPFVKFIWLNLVLAGVLLYIKRRKGLNVKNPFHIIDLFMVVAFGVFGFISVLIYPIRK